MCGNLHAWWLCGRKASVGAFFSQYDVFLGHAKETKALREIKILNSRFTEKFLHLVF